MANQRSPIYSCSWRLKLTMPKSKSSKCKAGNLENRNVEARLKREFRRLQHKYGLGLELKGVEWIPRGESFQAKSKRDSLRLRQRA